MIRQVSCSKKIGVLPDSRTMILPSYSKKVIIKVSYLTAIVIRQVSYSKKAIRQVPYLSKTVIRQVSHLTVR